MSIDGVSTSCNLISIMQQIAFFFSFKLLIYLKIIILQKNHNVLIISLNYIIKVQRLTCIYFKYELQFSCNKCQHHNRYQEGYPFVSKFVGKHAINDLLDTASLRVVQVDPASCPDLISYSINMHPSYYGTINNEIRD